MPTEATVAMARTRCGSGGTSGWWAASHQRHWRVSFGRWWLRRAVRQGLLSRILTPLSGGSHLAASAQIWGKSPWPCSPAKPLVKAFSQTWSPLYTQL
jgi:hypothetical protein